MKLLQWSSHNGITVSRIIRLMGSIFLRNPRPVCPWKSNVPVGYWYHSVYRISLSGSQSDPVKQRPLYLCFSRNSIYLTMENEIIQNRFMRKKLEQSMHEGLGKITNLVSSCNSYCRQYELHDETFCSILYYFILHCQINAIS